MLRNSGDHTSAHEALKVRLKGIGFVFGLQFPSFEVKRKDESCFWPDPPVAFVHS